MTAHKLIRSPAAPDGYEQLSTAEKLEEDASLASIAVSGALRAVDVAAVALLGLLVCPPLAILVVVVGPLLVMALVLGLLAAVLSAPYLLVQYLPRAPWRPPVAPDASPPSRRPSSHRLAPHRIVSATRKIASGR